MELIYPKEGVSAQADTPSFSTIILIYKIRIAVNTPLVPLKQIPRVELFRHVLELVTPAVGDDHVAAGLEGLQVVGHLAAEELRRVQRGLVDNHGHALGLHALHEALDGVRAEVVRVRLHRQAVHAHDRLLLAGIDAAPFFIYNTLLATRSVHVFMGPELSRREAQHLSNVSFPQ